MSGKCDTDGRPYAKLSEIRPGDRLEADDGFTCIKKGARLRVIKDYDGSLFVPCSCGGHHLHGQADDGEHLIGLYRVKTIGDCLAKPSP